MIDELGQDIRFALRLLLRRPGLSAVIVLTLGVGIAINATVFSNYYAVNLRPLPFPEPDRLVMLYGARPAEGRSRMAVSARDLEDLRRSPSLAAVGGFVLETRDLDTGGESQRVEASRVTASLFPLLGVEPLLGRGLSAEEDRAGGAPVALIGHRLWQRSFAGDPAVVGRTVRLDGVAHEIVGVMPPRFGFPLWEELWTPHGADPLARPRDARHMTMVARLAPGVARPAAEAELRAIAAQLAARFPDTNEGWSVDLPPLRTFWLPEQARTMQVAQLGAVMFVLLVVCANLANLLLSQANARRAETALRAALGADRWRLCRQALTESLLHAAAGGLLALVLTARGIEWMLGIVPVSLPYWIHMRLDAPVVLYLLLITVGTGAAVGLAPALRAAGGRLFAALQAGGRGAAPEGNRLRRTLVVAELAFSMLLLVGAMLMVKSFLRLQRADRGYAVAEVHTAQLSLSGVGYQTPERRRLFLGDVLGRLRDRPEVRAAGAVTLLPANGDGFEVGMRPVRLRVEGHVERPGEGPIAGLHAITDGYLEAIGVRLVAGRGLRAGEVAATTAAEAPVALINAALAAQLWPGLDPLGRRLRVEGAAEEPWLRVVGVVGDVQRGYQLYQSQRIPAHQIYLPLADRAEPIMSLAIASGADPAAVAAAVRAAARTADPSVPVYELYTMDQLLRRVEWIPRWLSEIFTLFAVLALAVAALGAYGVNTYLVTQRRHEMGVRLALGARPADVVRLVVGQGLALAAAGIAIGLLGALPMNRLLASLLYRAPAFDLQVLAAVALLLAGVALGASYLPAQRAAAVDPVTVLRSE